jgi:DNA-binding CsgD family transcriptional regulator
MVRQRAGSYFDPQVAEAYLDLAGNLWPPGDDPIPLAEVLSCDPGTPVDERPDDQRMAVCEALADFADLKSVSHGTHSHTVASLAGQAAEHLGLSAAEQEHLRRAGLVHDLGKIAVPYRLLEQADEHSSGGSHRGGTATLAEPVRLHPHYAQRILSRVRPLADLAADVGSHHERLDGSGFPLGPAAHGMPITARLLAAADVWAEQVRHGPPDLTAESGLDPACLAALRSSTRPGAGQRGQQTRTEALRAVLSARELEVLHLLADGASNPDIGKKLYISRRTAEHHVEHILAKLEVTSRTAAVAYALTHELLS